MPIKPPFPFMEFKSLPPFLNSMISANHEKGEETQPMGWNPYTPHCFSSVESLFSKYSLELKSQLKSEIKFETCVRFSV